MSKSDGSDTPQEKSVAGRLADREKNIAKREVAGEARRAERGIFRSLRRLFGLR